MQEGKKLLRIKDGCPLHPFECGWQGKELPWEWLEELTEEQALLLNPGKIITYGFTGNEVKAFFGRYKQELNVAPS